MTTQKGQRIAEGWLGFAIPGAGGDASLLGGFQSRCQQGHHREQAPQAGRGARDGAVGPLALGLDAKVITCLAERHFQRQTSDESTDDIAWITLGIGAQQRLRLEVAIGIAQQHPADWQHRLPGMIPHGTARTDLQTPFGVAIPTQDNDYVFRHKPAGEFDPFQPVIPIPTEASH